MSQAEELLKGLVEEVPDHTHVVIDEDSYFVINPDTREIENASRTKNILMQFDHNSEKFTFELARYVEGHDMTLCNRVRVHFNNIDGETNEENADVAELYDLDICPDDQNKVLCSWTITRQATQLAGSLNFLVQFECIDDAGNSVYEWHTDIFTDVRVKQSRINSEQAVIEYTNVLEQWYQRIFGAGDSVMANIVAEGEKQIAAVASEGEKQIEAVAEKVTEQVEAVAQTIVSQKVEEQVTVVTRTGTEQAAAVDAKGEEQITAIATAGEAQVTAVTTKGKEQVEAVAQKGEEYLGAIDEAYGKFGSGLKTVNGIGPDENGNVEIDIPTGGGSSIIDVVELPTENIREDCFYRLLTGTLVYNQITQNTFKVYCVETLPETGLPVTNADKTEGNIYYVISDGNAYGYVDENTSVGMGVPAGWYPGEILLSAIGYEYAGTITNILDDPLDGKFRLLFEYIVYDYKDGNWTSHRIIGKAGSGPSAEVFNHPSNIASGECSHAEGFKTHAQGNYSHAEGYYTHAEGTYSHAEGDFSNAEGYASHAEGYYTHAQGTYSHAEGYESHAQGDYSHAEGSYTHAEGTCSHAEGSGSHAQGDYSHAEGNDSYAQGESSHAEGILSYAQGNASHAEGNGSHAQGKYAHAEGFTTHAEGNYTHAEGDRSHAEKYCSHAEGQCTHAEGPNSHAEGNNSHAEGAESHAEGSYVHAQGSSSHAEGQRTHAEGQNSHAEGYYSHAVGKSQHVQGEYNLVDPEYNPDTPGKRAKYAHIVGNGEKDSNRSNAHTLDWNGLGWFAGGLKVGGTSQDDPNAQEVALKSDIPANEHIHNLVDEYMSENPVPGVIMADRTTGKKYIVYIDNGKLTMAESEG